MVNKIVQKGTLGLILGDFLTAIVTGLHESLPEDHRLPRTPSGVGSMLKQHD